MNKGLLGIILAVVLGAMVLIMFGQKGKQPTRPAETALGGQTQVNATASAARNATQSAPQNVTQSAGALRPAAQVPPPPARPANATAVAAAPVTPPAGATPPPLPKVEPPVSTPPANATTAPKPVTASPAPAAKPVEPVPAAKPAAKPESPKPEAAAAITPAKGPHTLKNIGLHFKGKAIVLRIESDNAFTGRTFVLPGPDRMVVDLAGEWNNLKAPSIPSNNLVKGVRIGKQSGGPRLVLDLTRPPKTHDAARPSPTVMEITIE